MRNNHNRKKFTSQEWRAIDCWPVDEITQDPEFFFSQLTRTQKNLINYFLSMSKACKMIYPSQSTIASKLGISRQHCASLIKWMRERGLIVSEYRHKLSCHYKLSSYFTNSVIKSRLRHIFSTFRKYAFSIGYLLSFSSDMTQDIKKLNKNNYFIIKRSGESAMKQFTQAYHGDKPVSEVIRNIQVFKLTRAGQIKLSPFPDEAIIDAQNAMRFAKNIREPFNWFYRLCSDYCKRNEIDPDWAFMYQLIEKYKISLSAPMIQEEKTPTRDKTSRVRDKTSQTEKKIDGTTDEYRRRTEYKLDPVLNTPINKQEWKRDHEELNPSITNFFYTTFTKGFFKRVMELD